MPTLTMEDLARLLAETAGTDPCDVTPQSTIHDLGIESIEIPRFLLKLEQRHGVKVSLAALALSRDVGDFHRLIAARGRVAAIPQA